MFDFLGGPQTTTADAIYIIDLFRCLCAMAVCLLLMAVALTGVIICRQFPVAESWRNRLLALLACTAIVCTLFLVLCPSEQVLLSQFGVTSEQLSDPGSKSSFRLLSGRSMPGPEAIVPMHLTPTEEAAHALIVAENVKTFMAVFGVIICVIGASGAFVASMSPRNFVVCWLFLVLCITGICAFVFSVSTSYVKPGLIAYGVEPSAVLAASDDLVRSKTDTIIRLLSERKFEEKIEVDE